MIKVRTTKVHRENVKLNIGGVLVEFNSNLEAEVTDEEAKILKEKDSSILLPGEEAPEEELPDEPVINGIPSPVQAAKMLKQRKKAREEAESKEKESSDDIDTPAEKEEVPVEEESSDDDGMDLESLTVAELKELCEGEEYPKEAWSSLKKSELVKYITKKIS